MLSRTNTMRPKLFLVQAALFALALFWTYLAVEFAPAPTNPIIGGLSHSTEDFPLWVSYVTLASASWAFAIFSFVRLSRKDHRDWTSAGLSDNLIDIMTKKRGALSRFRILKTLESPQHRGAVSNATGIDWREVTREVELLRDFGLIDSLGKKGNTIMYELTGKGRITLDLIQKKLKSEDTNIFPYDQEAIGS
jgi:hypothetical protein